MYEPSNLAFLEFLIGENPQNVPFLNTPTHISNANSNTTSGNLLLEEPFDLNILALSPLGPSYDQQGFSSSNQSENYGFSNATNLVLSNPLTRSRQTSALSNSTNGTPIIKQENSVRRENIPNIVEKFPTKDEKDSKKKSLKHKLDEVDNENYDKDELRAEQQRMASRRYRMKKKMVVEQLEAKLKEVNDEKQKIENEHNSTINLLSKLKNENEKLRKSVHFDSNQSVEEFEKELSKYISRLSDIISSRLKGKTIDPHSTELDGDIIPILRLIKDICRKLRTLLENLNHQ